MRPTPAAAHPRTIAAVAVGGAVGAVLRHGLAVALPVTPVGVGTVVGNLLGAFTLGVLATRGQGVVAAAFWRTGVLGAFTTFSALAVQTVELGVVAGTVYALVQLAAGVAAAAAGLRVGTRW